MTLQQFKKSLTIIKKTKEDHEKLQEALKNIFVDLGWLGIDKREIDMVEILKMAMDDKDDDIGYFMYEIDWGKRGKNCIEADGRKYSLRTYKELYDYLNKKV